jgi:hypothetical protein
MLAGMTVVLNSYEKRRGTPKKIKQGVPRRFLYTSFYCHPAQPELWY